MKKHYNQFSKKVLFLIVILFGIIIYCFANDKNHDYGYTSEINEIIHSAIESYIDEHDIDHDDVTISHGKDVEYIAVGIDNSKILSVPIRLFLYSGGASPAEKLISINIDKTTNEHIKIDDILKNSDELKERLLQKKDILVSPSLELLLSDDAPPFFGTYEEHIDWWFNLSDREKMLSFYINQNNEIVIIIELHHALGDYGFITILNE